MKTRLLLATFALALGLLGATALAASSHTSGTATARPDRSATNVHLSSKAPAFHGTVRSRAHVCVANRKVQVFRKDPAGDVLIGSDRADNRGSWFVRHPNFPSGEYYAKAVWWTNHPSSKWAEICLKDTSNAVVVD